MRVLVIGAGVAGISAAIACARAGMAVTLVERAAAWPALGAGITITGPTLRAMERLGILEGVRERGHTADGIVIHAQDGRVLSRIETGAGETGGAGGILRSVLQGLLVEQVERLPVAVRLGETVAVEPGAGGVRALFASGEAHRYDLVIAADGIHSATRRALFPEAPGPVPTGQGCWRLMGPTPRGVDRRVYFLGGPLKVGMTPVSAGGMYMFVLEPGIRRRVASGAEAATALAALVADYGGPVAEVRAAITPDSHIVYRPLETVLAPWPWHRGRVLLIGDAAHATTPQLASGAGMAIEDGLVIAECLASAPDVDGALEAFIARRYPRCKLVVEKSVELGRLEMARAAPERNQAVIEHALAALAEPY
ncbi:MAG: FAD-dependent monooxygenase [Rhodobacteraceae bacterium]|nr:FAD-dependent monooxygenase [Paracoccaceae bacterium]